MTTTKLTNAIAIDAQRMRERWTLALTPSPSLDQTVRGKQAKYLLRTLHTSCLHGGLILSPIVDMERQLENELNLNKAQSMNFDWLSQMMDQLKVFLESCDLHNETLLKKVESCAIFAYQVSRSSSLTDCTVALLALVNSLFNQSVTALITNQIVQQFTNIFNFTEVSSEMTPQSMEDIFDAFRDKFDFIGGLKDLPIMSKLHKFFLYTLSFSILDGVGLSFDACGYSKFESEAIRRAHGSKFGFWHCLFDGLSLFCQQFTKAIKTGSFQPFFHSCATYDTWCTMAFKLKREEQFLSNPAPHGFDVFTFRSQLDAAIDEGQSILKHIPINKKFERERLRALVNDLELIKSRDITKKSSQRDRAAPFAVMLAGGSSVGKSHFTNILFQYFGNLMSLPTGTEYKYTRNFTAEFWDGFNSSQWFVILDDIASLSPRLNVLDPSLADIIQVVNNVAFIPNQAELADKGRTPCLARLVVATTNTPDMNAHAYFACPLAIMRRLPWCIEISPKREFAQDNMIMLDPRKCLTDQDRLDAAQRGEPEAFDDYWVIKVSKVIPAGDTVKNQRGKFSESVVYDNINDFLAWFGSTAMSHEQQQASLANAEAEMKAINVCKTCCRPSYSCTCLVVQACTEVGFPLIAARTWTYLSVFKWFLSASMTWGFLYYFQLMLYYIYMFLCRWSYFNCQQIPNIVVRFALRRLGASLESRLEPFQRYFRIFAACASVISIGTICYSLMPSKKSKEVKQYEQQVDVADIGCSPAPRFEERENVWYNTSFTVTPFDVAPASASWLGQPKEWVRKTIQTNLLRFRFKVDDHLWKNTGAFALGGFLYAFNHHALPEGDSWELQILSGPKKDGVTPNIHILVTRSQIMFFPSNDLCIINIQNLPPRKDLTGLLAMPTFTGKYVGEYLALSRDGVHTQNPVKDIVCTTSVWLVNEVKTWTGFTKDLTQVGDCGSVLLVHAPTGPVLLGLHALGNLHSQVIATPLTPEMVSDARTFFSEFQIQAGEPALNSDSATHREITTLDFKSPLRWFQSGTANVYGSLTGPRARPKSHVIRTCMADVAETYGYVQKYGPPVMTGWVPWRTALSDMLAIPTVFRQDIIDECVLSFTDDILCRLSETELKQVEIYNMFTSINGASGVAYIDKLNRSTSMGFPWCKSKKYYMTAIPCEQGVPDPVDISDEIKQRVQLVIDTYNSGKRYMPVFKAHLKDEATSFKKIATGKTRVFGGAPVDWSIVVRMYLLSTVRLIQNNRFIFESAPGTIAQSGEWGEIRSYLTSFGDDRLVAGDYKAFDKNMPPMFILGAFKILMNICRAAGFPEEALQVIWGIAIDTAFPLYDLNGDLIEFFGSEPSGHNLTVIINGLANSLYMRYAYYLINPAHEVKTFKDNVHLMTYGDDNAMGVKPGCNWFNHTAIQKTLGLHGITYTMADKEAESVPFISIQQVSFLKRTWLWCDDVQNYLCPLEHDSIEKSIMTCTASKSVSAEYQGISILSSACQEYFFYGEQTFHKRRNMLLEIAHKSELDELITDTTFPTWRSLCDRFLAYPAPKGWSVQLEKLTLKG